MHPDLSLLYTALQASNSSQTTIGFTLRSIKIPFYLQFLQNMNNLIKISIGAMMLAEASMQAQA